MTLYRKIAVMAACIFLIGCQELPNYFVGDNTLARVGRTELQLRDVVSAAPSGVSGEDSAAFVTLYIDRWIKKQLKLQEAELLFSDAAQDIDKMVQEYRQSLLIRKLDQYYVDRSIDTTFTESDLAAYYNAHKAEFRLDRTIVKGRILRFGEGNRQARKLLTLMQQMTTERQKSFRDICEKNNFVLTEYTDSWVDFPEFLSHLPVLQSQNYDSMLGTHEIQQMRDSYSHYYFQITAVRRAGDDHPLECVRENIRRILFTQRQGEVVKSHEQEIYARGIEDGEVRIYEKENN